MFNPARFITPSGGSTGGAYNREAAKPLMPHSVGKFEFTAGVVMGPSPFFLGFHQKAQWVYFSTGRRKCAGESMMRNVLFLTTGSLLQRFRFQLQLQEGVPPPKWDEFLDNFIPIHTPYNVTLTAHD